MTAPCPVCAFASGFHGPACHDYTRSKDTRPPGRAAFDQWLNERRNRAVR